MVLDAKYRLDTSPGYVRRYGIPGPPPSVYNDLHRYRDAIVDSLGRKRVVQALALYPYHPTEAQPYAGSRLADLVDRVGVGALPLLPGETASLRAWLMKVVEAAR